MAKVTAPLLSMGASGQIGKTLVNATWKGRAYSRRYVIPANTPSEGKSATKGVFSWLQASWKYLPAAVSAVWAAAAKGAVLTDRNAWTKANLQALRGIGTDYATTLDLITASPGVGGGYAPATCTAVDGTDGTATVTMTSADLPAGWAVVNAHFIAWEQQNPSTGTTYQPFYIAVANPGPYTYGLATGDGTFVVSGFFEYTNAAGKTVYGPSSTPTPVVVTG